MGNINLSFNKPKSKKKEKVILTYHPSVSSSKAYYTYTDESNHERVFEDSSYIISKVSATRIVAKKNIVSKIDLQFVPEEKGIDYKPAYFTYNDNKLYFGEPIYDDESCSYIGKLDVIDIYDKEIRIFEE